MAFTLLFAVGALVLALIAAAVVGRRQGRLAALGTFLLALAVQASLLGLLLYSHIGGG